MDGGVATRIARLATQPDEHPPVSPEGLRVLEVGAGTGQLTHALLEAAANVTALEIDDDLVRVLRSRDELRDAHVLVADALAFDYAAYAGAERWRVTGNLPYNIATPLIMQLVEMPRGPEQLIVMIQKDVADRLAAKPSTPAYGSLSVAVQYAMRVERAFTLGPSVFFPRPKVDSAVVRLIRRERPAVSVRDETRFRQVVRAAFAYRRKTLANSLALALGIPRESVMQALHALHIDMEIRGEQLDITDFGRLADQLAT